VCVKGFEYCCYHVMLCDVGLHILSVCITSQMKTRHWGSYKLSSEYRRQRLSFYCSALLTSCQDVDGKLKPSSIQTFCWLLLFGEAVCVPYAISRSGLLHGNFMTSHVDH